MHDTAWVGEGHVRAGEDVAGDGLPEDFDAERISYDFFGFALKVGVHEGDVVVCAEKNGPLADAPADLNFVLTGANSLQHTTFPSADNRSSIRSTFTLSGSVFRRCCSS